MLEVEVLICEFLGAVDCSGAGAVAVDEVSSLDHEALDLDVHQQLDLQLELS